MATTILAFDYGKRRIGTAVGNAITGTATPLTTISHAEHISPWPAIEALVAEWKPDQLVCGLPLHVDGERQAFTEEAESFAKQLARRCQLPVAMMDETLSSAEATANLKWQRQAGRKRKVRKEEIDAQAARIILEAWLRSH